MRNVTFMGKRKGMYKILVGKPEGDYLEDLGIDEMILKWIFKRRYILVPYLCSRAQVRIGGLLLQTR